MGSAQGPIHRSFIDRSSIDPINRLNETHPQTPPKQRSSSRNAPSLLFSSPRKGRSRPPRAMAITTRHRRPLHPFTRGWLPLCSPSFVTHTLTPGRLFSPTRGRSVTGTDGRLHACLLPQPTLGNRRASPPALALPAITAAAQRWRANDGRRENAGGWDGLMGAFPRRACPPLARRMDRYHHHRLD